MSSESSDVFSGIRAFLWPIHRWEIKKFLPLIILYALICFNYSLLKAAKDALVITANDAGAAVIPFIKIWAILPMAFLMTYLFTRLFSRFTQEQVFYIMIGGFLSFFTIFALILYPLRDAIHPHGFCIYLQTICPSGFIGLIGMLRYWSFTLFYVMSELWGTTVMSVLFWAFANEVMTVKDAKRFYGILGIGANISAIFAGQVAILASGQLFDLSSVFGSDIWGQSLGLVTAIVVFTGLLCIAVFRWYNLHVVSHYPSMKREGSQNRAVKDKKMRMGIWKSLSYLAKSKYLLCMAILVIGFNLAINMVEIIWKDQIRLVYPNPIDFNAYMGNVLKATGCVSTFVGLFISGNVIRKMGWTFSALITPVALLITGIFFFGALLLKNNPLFSTWSANLGLTPVAFGVLFGTIQNVLSRGCKYTFFDATKEMAFIPLSSESKFKGKAAIDGVGSRLGKTGGSIIHGGLFIMFGSLSLITSFMGAFFLFVVLGWIIATKSLGRQFNRLAAEEGPIEMEERFQEGLEASPQQPMSVKVT